MGVKKSVALFTPNHRKNKDYSSANRARQTSVELPRRTGGTARQRRRKIPNRGHAATTNDSHKIPTRHVLHTHPHQRLRGPPGSLRNQAISPPTPILLLLISLA